MYNCSAPGSHDRREISDGKFLLQQIEEVGCSGNPDNMFTVAGTSQYGVKQNSF